MNCPICDHKGLEPDAATCPACKSDLTAFQATTAIEASYKKQKNTSMIFIILFIIALLGCVIIYLFTSPPGTSKEDKEKMVQSETTIRTLTAENQKLKTDIAELKAKQAELLAQKEAAEPKASTHIVEEGETLYLIASKYLGDGNLYTKIAADNGIEDPNMIAQGQEIIIYQ